MMSSSLTPVPGKSLIVHELQVLCLRICHIDPKMQPRKPSKYSFAVREDIRSRSSQKTTIPSS